MQNEIRVGQVWRDTDGDARRRLKGLPPNPRTVRVEGREDDGRWRVMALTSAAGSTDPSRLRQTRVKAETLQTKYEFVSEAAPG